MIWFLGGVIDCIIMLISNNEKNLRKIKLNKKIGNLPHHLILLHVIIHISSNTIPISKNIFINVSLKVICNILKFSHNKLHFLAEFGPHKIA